MDTSNTAKPSVFEGRGLPKLRKTHRDTPGRHYQTSSGKAGRAAPIALGDPSGPGGVSVRILRRKRMLRDPRFVVPGRGHSICAHGIHLWLVVGTG